jgi:hypothetical protein
VHISGCAVFRPLLHFKRVLGGKHGYDYRA